MRSDETTRRTNVRWLIVAVLFVITAINYADRATISLSGAVRWLGGAAAVAVLFALRFLVGAAEAPSFPANSRIVAAWFPASERGTASAIFNSAQYAATVVFAPLMGWVIHTYGWHAVFGVMGVFGML